MPKVNELRGGRARAPEDKLPKLPSSAPLPTTPLCSPPATWLLCSLGFCLPAPAPFPSPTAGLGGHQCKLSSWSRLKVPMMSSPTFAPASSREPGTPDGGAGIRTESGQCPLCLSAAWSPPMPYRANSDDILTEQGAPQSGYSSGMENGRKGKCNFKN